jgi:ABC-type uncharacterized transport system substrate-binding protein
VNRRDLMLLLVGALAIAPAVRAQKRTPVIGFLGGNSRGEPLIAAFEQGLNENGFTDRQNVEVEYRWANSQWDRLPALAHELADRKVDVITTSGGDIVALAAKEATSTIPIVAQMGGDPIGEGLVSSLARPGGNLTGVSFLTLELIPKRLELLSELVPHMRAIALLVNPKNPKFERHIKYGEEAAHAKGVRLDILQAGTEAEIDMAFANELHADALVVSADPFLASRSRQLVPLAARHAIPAIYEWRYFVDSGGLMSYGASLTDAYRNAGIYVGRILKGARPADLPVEQPTKFELVMNMKTAKALGITVPQSLLARADEVIE